MDFFLRQTVCILFSDGMSVIQEYLVKSIFYAVESFFFLVGLELTLPYLNHVPSQVTQLYPFFFISFYVTLYFCFPPICSGFGQNEVFASFMFVPETSVYEYSG